MTKQITYADLNDEEKRIYQIFVELGLAEEQN